MKSVRKIIAALMSISFIFTATVAVNAENGAISTKEQFQAALATGGSYELEADLEDMTNSGITADVKIDGKGRVLTSIQSDKNATIYQNAAVESNLNNMTVNGNEKADIGIWYGNGTGTLERMTIQNFAIDSGKCAAVAVGSSGGANYGTLNLNEVKFSNNSLYDVYVSDAAVLNINKGTELENLYIQNAGVTVNIGEGWDGEFVITMDNISETELGAVGAGADVSGITVLDDGYEVKNDNGVLKISKVNTDDEGKPIVNITKDLNTKCVTFVDVLDPNNTYEVTDDAASLPAGTYSVTAAPYAPATYELSLSKNTVTVTESAGDSVTVSSSLRTESPPQTDYEVVRNNIIEWNAENGYNPSSLNYINSVQYQKDIPIAGATVGSAVDSPVYMFVNTENGKFHTYGRSGAMQINGGTVLKIPVVKDTKVTLNASSFVYTVDGDERSGTEEYYYFGEEDGYAEFTIITGGYAASITTTPLSRSEVSGDIEGVESGCLMFSDIISGDEQYAYIENGGYRVSLIKGQTYVVKYGTMTDGVFKVSDTNSTDVGAITPSDDAQTQNIKITDLREYVIGGDVVGIKDGDTLAITDGTAIYDAVISDGKWSASAPGGIYTLTLNSQNNGELSPLSKNAFSVFEDDGEVKNALVKYPVKPESRREITVGKGCDYETINAALEAVAANGAPESESERVTIALKAGETFREQVKIQIPYVTFISDADDPATVTWYYGVGYKYYSAGADGLYGEDRAVAKTEKNYAGDWGSAIIIGAEATDFKAENIRFENSCNIEYTDEERADGVEISDGYNRTLDPGDEGYQEADSRGAQAVAAAVSVGADRCEFKNCSIVSNQDTLYTSGNCRIYFKECSIEGNVDYIFGSGYCVFEKCELVSAGYSDRDGGGYITANGSNGSDGYYLFRDCTVKNSDVDGRRFGAIAWGRNWGGDTSNVYFMNTSVAEGTITPTGWGGWGEVANAPLYVYDMNDMSVGSNVNDNMHGVLTYEEAYEKYYSSVSMMGDWSPNFMTRANDITISDEYVELKTNETKQLQAAVLPEGAADDRVSWSSSAPEIAAVDRTGKVTAVSKGEAVIAASAVDGDYKAECVVTVTDGIDETGYPYEIDDILLRTASGEILESPPSDQGFIVEASLSKLKPRDEKDYLFIAVYDKDGILLNLDYVNASFAENYDYSFGFYVPPQNAEIGMIKAYVWNDFNNMEPLAECMYINNTVSK